MATIEDRVTKLEQDVQEIRSDVNAGPRAQAYGLSLVQSEVAEVRTDLAGLRGEAGDLRTEMQTRFAGVESTLQQILERLERR